MMMPSILKENLFDNLWNGFSRPLDVFPTNVMRTDVKDLNDHYELSVELPGVKKEDLKVELKDGTLTISATYNTEQNQESENGRYVRKERYSGSTSRSFYLGDTIKQEDVHAAFSEGILTLNIQKAAPEPEVIKDYTINID